MVFLFLVFFVLCIVGENSSISQKRFFLFASIIVISIMAGSRDIYVWPDTLGYQVYFLHRTPSIGHLSFSENHGYVEKGFFILSSIIKTFTSNPVIYFTLVAFIGLWILSQGINKYTLFPLFAFALYVSRFMFGRQFIQIRAGVSIAIIFWGMQYVAKRDLKRYLVVIFIASLLHMSAWIALPAYFLHKIKLKPKHIYWTIGFAFILAAFFTPVIRSFISDSAADLNVAQSYTSEEYGYKSTGKGLANPMVYYQTLILILFTLWEKKLSKVTPYYITLRNGYFYSTIWLITLCSYSVLSARGSTILATYEILIIPSFVRIFHKNNRVLAYILIGLLSVLWFYLNLGKRA